MVGVYKSVSSRTLGKGPMLLGDAVIKQRVEDGPKQKGHRWVG